MGGHLSVSGRFLKKKKFRIQFPYPYLDKRFFRLQKLSRAAPKHTGSVKSFHPIIRNSTDILFRKWTNSLGQSTFWKASTVNSGEILSPFQRNLLIQFQVCNVYSMVTVYGFLIPSSSNTVLTTANYKPSQSDVLVQQHTALRVSFRIVTLDRSS
jgi:hypothetical protein